MLRGPHGPPGVRRGGGPCRVRRRVRDARAGRIGSAGVRRKGQGCPGKCDRADRTVRTVSVGLGSVTGWTELSTPLQYPPLQEPNDREAKWGDKRQCRGEWATSERNAGTWLWTGCGRRGGGVDLAEGERWGGDAVPGTGGEYWGECAAPAHVVERSRQFPNELCCLFPPNHHLSPHVLLHRNTFQRSVRDHLRAVPGSGRPV
jgi:hypothetical protein